MEPLAPLETKNYDTRKKQWQQETHKQLNW